MVTKVIRQDKVRRCGAKAAYFGNVAASINARIGGHSVEAQNTGLKDWLVLGADLTHTPRYPAYPPPCLDDVLAVSVTALCLSHGSSFRSWSGTADPSIAAVVASIDEGVSFMPAVRENARPEGGPLETIADMKVTRADMHASAASQRPVTRA